MENKKINIDKCKYKFCFLLNGVENIEKILQNFKTLLQAERNLLQTLISKTEYERFLSSCLISKTYEPEIMQKANQIIKDFSKKNYNRNK